MIECNKICTRTRDEVEVYARFCNGYVEKETHKYFSEIPEGRAESEFYTFMRGRIRQEETGLIYNTAHDIDPLPYTYTELYPDPADAVEWYDATTTAATYTFPVFNVYPTYRGTVTYHRGDIVVHNSKEWICDVDESTGVNPDVYGWDEYKNYVETVEPVYKTLAELYPEDYTEEASE